MLRWLTAGESHGPALVGTLEGLPAGVHITSDAVREALARRRLGYGRGARMSFEQDEVTFLGGVRHGLTQGGPVAIMVGNTEWPKWETVMSADPVDPEELVGARGAALTRPRPGHADLVGMTKYGFDDARPVLERASARETAARVALGAVAEAFLREAAGVELVAHTVQVGTIMVPDERARCLLRAQPKLSTTIPSAASMRRRRPRWWPRSMSAKRTATRLAEWSK